MASNRDYDFVKHVVNRIAGIAVYQKSANFEDDVFIIILKRAAANKATRIDFRPDRKGAVNVNFFKVEAGVETVVSTHLSVPFDGLAPLLLTEAGLLTGVREKEEGVGLYKTSKW
jgi:hypothetical protein